MKVVCLLFAVHFASSFVNSVEIKEFKSDGKLNQGLDIQLKVSNFRKQIMVPKLLPKNKPSQLSWKITTSRLIQKESLCSFCKKIASLLY